MHDDLLTKYMLGETTPEENSAIERWLQEDEANEKQFAHFKLIWETSKRLALVSTVDEHEAWNRFKQRRAQSVSSQPNVKPLIPWFNPLKVAAVLLLVSIGAWASYTFFNSSAFYALTAVHIETENEVRMETLPDGSVVTLNRNSHLRYARRFSGTQREVILQEGEAFFNVTPDPSKPFVVKANDVTVRVLGTSFNVKSRTDKTEVIVETGKVQVSRNENTVRLTPKEMVTVHPGDAGLAKETNTDQLYTYYRSKVFVADNTPLWRVVEVLNEAYDANIIIERKELYNLPLTTTFKNQSLDTIIDIISQTFDLTVVKQDNRIILK